MDNLEYFSGKLPDFKIGVPIEYMVGVVPDIYIVNNQTNLEE